MQLDKIDVLVLQRFVNSLSAGSKEGKKPLAPTSTARVVAVLRSIMRQAYLWKLIASRDLTRDLSLPRIEIRSRTLPDPARLQQFLAFLREKDPDLHALAVVGLSTGLRRGEMLALKWSNIDWQRSLLYVVGSLSKVHGQAEVKGTKTGQVRVIALPGAAAEVLKQQRLRQEERRRFYGAAYRTDLDLVFGNDHGGFLDPSATSKRFGALSQSCGLDLTLHGLRHLHASLLLAYGAGLPLVSSRLGHATTQTTARQYAHVLQSDLDVAAQLWNTRIAPLLQPPDSASGSGKPN
jgi:integrase